ncbi:MAG TPA: META domain-containing protein [Jiangellaceae bacterium]|nr:META domain-containing protein [Jiangellaceae bacterium]
MTAAVVTLLLAGSCGDQNGTTSNGGDLAGRTFLSESVTEDGQARELVAGTRISLDFTTDGQISANAGCNHLFGDVTIQPDRLEVGPMGGTEMGCDQLRHEQDEWLMAFLEDSPAWTLDGDRLTLTAGGTEIVLLDREVADPDRPLEGTRWLVDTIISGEAASSMWAGTEGSAWLFIEGDRFTASSGCRDFEGSVDIGSDSLRFGETAQTDPICPEELREVDEAMQTIFASEVEFSIEAARLTLTQTGGVGLGLHADE